MAEKEKSLTTKEIASALNVTDRTIKSWVQKGCPVRRVKPRGKKGGHPRLNFSMSKVIDWCIANDISIERKEDQKDVGSYQQSTATETEPVRDEDLPKSGIVGAVARLRAMERISYAAFVSSVKQRDSADKVRAKEKIYIAAHEALRRTEKDVTGILEHRGKMIPLETVLQEQSKIDLAIKNELLTLPRKLAPDLASISDAGEIEEYLTGQIDDILRHIASGEFLQKDTVK